MLLINRQKTKRSYWKYILIPAILTLLLFAALAVKLASTNKHYDSFSSSLSQQASLRKFPFPYRTALTISSDIDGTTSLKEFLVIQEFLNTTNETAMGTGVGLEIGNSFFPVSEKGGEVALLSGSRQEKEVIVDLMGLGYIDFIHSFNIAADRSEINNILPAIQEAGIELDVWVNHGNVSNNLGPSPWTVGDNPGSKVYHSDISKDALGYDFVWIEDVSSVVGQGRPLTFFSFFDALDRDHIWSSLKNNVLKEFSKYFLSHFKGTKYSARKNNDLVSIIHLDDGSPVFKFVRSNLFYKDVGGEAATADKLHFSLRPEILQKLIQNEGYSIIYTHLGKNKGFPYLSSQATEGLRLLQKEFKQGNILVTTSAKLLNYYVNRRYLKRHVQDIGDGLNIYIDGIEDPVRGKFQPTLDDLQGITFYVTDPDNTKIFLGGKEIHDITRNSADHTGRKSIMINWRPLLNCNTLYTEYKKKGYF